MRQSDRCVVNVAVGARFIPYQNRLRGTLREFSPGADLLFWTEEWPPLSPTHLDNPYAFKQYAIQEAVRQGYRLIMYVDSPARAVAPLAPMWDRAAEDGYLVFSGDDKLGNWTHDAALTQHGFTRDEAMLVPMITGMPQIFDMSSATARLFCQMMHRAAASGIFRGDYIAAGAPQEWKDRKPEKSVGLPQSDPRCWGHRGDEAVGTMLMHQLGMRATPMPDLFVGDTPRTIPGECMRSGYDLPPTETIHGHTFRMDLIGPGSCVLDVGAWDCGMAADLARRGLQVVALDPAFPVPPPKIPGLRCVEKALVASSRKGRQHFCKFGDGQANYCTFGSLPAASAGCLVDIPSTDIDSLRHEVGVDCWSAVKLNCEGAEFDILLEWPGPIASQISVSFHEHTPARALMGENYYDRMLAHLGKWYVPYIHVRSRKYGFPEPNYWDSLFVLKELA